MPRSAPPTTTFCFRLTTEYRDLLERIVLNELLANVDDPDTVTLDDLNLSGFVRDHLLEYMEEYVKVVGAEHNGDGRAHLDEQYREVRATHLRRQLEAVESGEVDRPAAVPVAFGRSARGPKRRR